MKKFIVITLSFVLSVLIFTSCSSSISPPTEKDDTSLYQDTIERYFNALIKADTDALLDSLDPGGLLYPGPEAIERLRDNADGSAIQGEVVVEDLSVIEKTADRVQVKAEIFYKVDLHNTGDFEEETTYFTFELTYVNGKWLIYNFTVE